MPRFKCMNEGCSMYEKEIIKEHIKYRMKEGRLKPDPQVLCQECEMEMDEIPTGNTGGFFFNKFDSLTTHEKRQVIHKRSMEHFKKKDKGDLANYKQKIIDDNKRMVGGK